MSSMPEPASADQSAVSGVIVGVDTHKDAHVAAVVSELGVLLGHQRFPATAVGYGQLLDWARSFGVLTRAGVEGTSSFGIGLTRSLRKAGVDVVEVNRPDKATRRRVGKNDAIDAEAAARAVLSGRASAVAKAGDGPVEAIRMFHNARASAVKSRTQAINQLKSVLVRADPRLRESLTGLSSTKLLRACAALPAEAGTSPTDAHVYTLRLLAHRIINLTQEIDQLTERMTTVITAHCPELLQRPSIGPETAATLLITAGDNPQRLSSEQSFAALCGTSPVEASSGKTERHRLNRGGNRQANRALHMIVISRLRWDAQTREYMQRRTAEGKSKREIIRCLKRYAAREIYNLITTQP